MYKKNLFLKKTNKKAERIRARRSSETKTGHVRTVSRLSNVVVDEVTAVLTSLAVA